jgi:hypothetical protein
MLARCYWRSNMRSPASCSSMSLIAIHLVAIKLAQSMYSHPLQRPHAHPSVSSWVHLCCALSFTCHSRFACFLSKPFFAFRFDRLHGCLMPG